MANFPLPTLVKWLLLNQHVCSKSTKFSLLLHHLGVPPNQFSIWYYTKSLTLLSPVRLIVLTNRRFSPQPYRTENLTLLPPVRLLVLTNLRALPQPHRQRIKRQNIQETWIKRSYGSTKKTKWPQRRPPLITCNNYRSIIYKAFYMTENFLTQTLPPNTITMY